jgi:SPP1 gp7 family putative phage head morphogenesis protein
VKHKDYWRKRFIELENAQNTKNVEFYQDIEKLYNKAIEDINKDLVYWYERYARKNKITLSDAKKQLNSEELKEFKLTVDQYIEKGHQLGVQPDVNKELERASTRFHVSRLQALKLQMQAQLEFVGAQFNDKLNDHLQNTYRDNYYKTAYEIQKGFKTGFDFMQLDENEINKIVSNGWTYDGKTFSDRIWSSQTKLINDLNVLLGSNIARGEDPQKSINELAKKMKVSKFQAGRLIMTESAYFNSLAKKDCLKDLDVEEFEISATLDQSTSDICQNMDGRHFPMTDYEIGVTAPPFHPFCRSTTIPYFNDEFTELEFRASRDKKDKGYHVIPANIKYKEWMDKFITIK